MHLELERDRVVNEVGHLFVKGEGLRRVAAERNVEACLLSWRDHLRDWGSLHKLFVCDYQADVDVLSEIVCDNKALCSC